ncbi:MAG: glycosyltransferase [Syntrophobacteraceae bacterium]
MKQASCLALLSYQETAPIVIGEALATGLPVLGSRLCGLPFMIEDGQTGYLVDPDNLEGISARIHSLVTDKQLNSAMSERCGKVALDRFHPEAIARKTMGVYREILHSPAPK